jgi:hypothetical protein
MNAVGELWGAYAASRAANGALAIAIFSGAAGLLSR